MFVGNGGPNLVSSFHVIGEIFDTLYQEGGRPALYDVQTTLIPAGGAMMAEFETQVPGTCILVDHSIFRAFNKGALGMLSVEGPANEIVYSGREVDEVYLAERSKKALEAVKGVDPRDQSLDARIARGTAVYKGTCSTCHQPNGEGLPGVFPPLAKSDYLLENTTRAIRIVIAGKTGVIEVNGQSYNGVMPPLGNFTDHEIADVLTCVLNSFGNPGGIIENSQVADMRNRLQRPVDPGQRP